MSATGRAATGESTAADRQRVEAGQQQMLTDLALGVFTRERLSAGELSRAPLAVRDRVVASATIGYLIAAGVINVDPHELAWAPLALPEHLRPDVEAMVASVAAARKRIFGQVAP